MPDQIQFDQKVGNRIRELRVVRRVTQADLARKAGVTFQQIQKYERGVNRISGARLVKLAEALSTTVADLLGQGNPDEHPETGRLLQDWANIQDPIKREAVLKIVAALAA